MGNGGGREESGVPGSGLPQNKVSSLRLNLPPKYFIAQSQLRAWMPLLRLPTRVSWASAGVRGPALQVQDSFQNQNLGRCVRPGKAVLPRDLTIVDVGTGSGCIAISLKLELPEAKILATDISSQALTIAKDNANKINAAIIK